MEKKFILYKKTTNYSKYTQYKYYIVLNKKQVKKFKPVTLSNGERLKENIATKEKYCYTLEERQQSIRQSIRRTQEQVFALCDSNDFEWFITLTFDPDKIDRTNPDLVVDCYKKWIMSLQHKCPELKYLTVPELHENQFGGKCLHFHILMSNIPVDILGLTNSNKVCCSWATKKNGICSKSFFELTKEQHLLTLPDGTKMLPKTTDGIPIYNVSSFIYGMTTASRIVDKKRTASYVRTYVQKGFLSMADILYCKRYYYSRNLNLPENWVELLSVNEKSLNVKDYVKNTDKYVGKEKVSVVNNLTYNITTLRVDNDILKSNVDKLEELSFVDKQKLKLNDLFKGDKNDKRNNR